MPEVTQPTGIHALSSAEQGTPTGKPSWPRSLAPPQVFASMIKISSVLLEPVQAGDQRPPCCQSWGSYLSSSCFTWEHAGSGTPGLEALPSLDFLPSWQLLPSLRRQCLFPNLSKPGLPELEPGPSSFPPRWSPFPQLETWLTQGRQAWFASSPGDLLGGCFKGRFPDTLQAGKPTGKDVCAGHGSTLL